MHDTMTTGIDEHMPHAGLETGLRLESNISARNVRAQVPIPTFTPTNSNLTVTTTIDNVASFLDAPHPSLANPTDFTSFLILIIMSLQFTILEPLYTKTTFQRIAMGECLPSTRSKCEESDYRFCQRRTKQRP